MSVSDSAPSSRARRRTASGPAPRTRRTVLVGALARASAMLPSLSTDVNQLLAQLGAQPLVAAAMLWSAAANGEEDALVHASDANGCVARHRDALLQHAAWAAQLGAPLQARLACEASGEHEVFAVPYYAASNARPPASGALVLLTPVGEKFAEADLLLAALTAVRLGEASQREPPGDAAARQADLRGRLLAGVIAAAENERKRIAADIHDDTLQTMGMQLVKVHIIERLLERGDTQEARQELEALGRSIQENADRLRAIMSELRPSTLRDYGLLATIDDLIQRFQAQTGIPVTFVSRLGRRLPDDHETMVYRIVQEALSNIRKHAHATRASIQLEGMGDWYTLTIEDDGQGFHPYEAIERSLRTGHLGLVTMRERAELIGGSFAIESTPGTGTRLRFQLPRLS